ncbi:hypothetical protein EXE42_00810 [Halorubrum sp. SP3]|uniref:hypothetical protein n=1 Tax=unclassified Halorubrum TaxID=2642239 RepID=UPI0010F5A3B6|nr:MULTISPECIES: hypothetical protein [unclassified Halorubrum]TKX56132.1 hypothetical protein EXE42_00810 [Halorubrum sp. SP3]TKX71150.1 hypothetical protein EXE45_02715 [Halorubrum sp. SP9]
MTDHSINRRRLIGMLSGTGIAAFVGLGYAAGDPIRYTYASSHSCDEYTLDAEWRETYTRNGETTLLEDTTPDGSGSEPDEPGLIQLDNVLPGDRGTVSFSLTADRTNPDASDTVSPTLGIDLTDRAENGLTDPEEAAGDTTETVGELQEYLQVTVWKNTGILGIDALGADDLTQQITEPTLSEGTLADVAADLSDEELGTIDATVDDDSVSVTLRWEFANDAHINEAQTDSVTFALDIGCGGDSA